MYNDKMAQTASVLSISYLHWKEVNDQRKQRRKTDAPIAAPGISPTSDTMNIAIGTLPLQSWKQSQGLPYEPPKPLDKDVAAKQKEASSQRQMLQEQFKSLVDILSQKIDSSELMHKRYQQLAEDVLSSAKANLESVRGILKSIADIDVPYIKKRVEQLKAMSDTEMAVKSLEARLATRLQQLSRIDALLAENEIALTQLVETTAALANMKTQCPDNPFDMDDSVKNLSDMTNYCCDERRWNTECLTDRHK